MASLNTDVKKEQSIKNKLATLIIHYTQDELEARFLKDFGCINFRDNKFMEELELAREFHYHHKQLHPEKHDEHETEPFRCYHKTVCKCGFSEAVDSSD